MAAGLRTNISGMQSKKFSTFVLVAVLALFLGIARADDPAGLRLTLKDHVFESKELKAPAGKDIAIMLKNEDASSAKFDSDSLSHPGRIS